VVGREEYLRRLPAALDAAIRLLEEPAGPASAFARCATADKEAGHYVRPGEVGRY